MAQSIIERERDWGAYLQADLTAIAVGLGALLFALSAVFDQPGLSALLTIAFLLRLVRYPI